jgi:hypothetical protein
MISKRKPYNTYTKEFKLEAIRLMNESDRPANSILKGLAITCSLCDLQQLWILGAEAANCQMWDVRPDLFFQH